MMNGLHMDHGGGNVTEGMESSTTFEKCQDTYVWTNVNLSYSYHNHSRISSLQHFNHLIREQYTLI